MKTIPTLIEIYKKEHFETFSKDGIGWLKAGDSPKSVLLIHGITGGALDMMPLAQKYLTQSYAVYSLSLPGHGSSVLGELQSYDDLSDWFQSALKVMDIKPQLIISNSYASSIIYNSLRRGDIEKDVAVVLGCPTPDPSRLARTLDAAASYLPSKITWRVYNALPVRRIRTSMLLMQSRKQNPAAWAWLLESERNKYGHTSMKATNVLTGLLSSQNPYLKPLPANLKNKLIVVIGDKDNVVTKKAIGMMRHQAPMAKFKIVHGVGHILHFEAINDLVIRDS